MDTMHPMPGLNIYASDENTKTIFSHCQGIAVSNNADFYAYLCVIESIASQSLNHIGYEYTAQLMEVGAILNAVRYIKDKFVEIDE